MHNVGMCVEFREHPHGVEETRAFCSIAGILAGVGAGTSLISGILGASAASSAADAQVQAAQLASQTQLKMFDTTQGNLQPYMQAGAQGQTNALSALLNTLGLGWGATGPGTPGGSNFGPTNPMLAALGFGGPGGQPGKSPAFGNVANTFQTSPGYEFAREQGLNAITNAASRTGGLGGNTLKSLQSYGTGLANQDWYNYLNQLNSGYSNLTGQLQSLIGGGQNAAANLGGFSTTVGGQVGNNIIGAGNAQAAGQIGSANALAGGLGGIGNSALLYALMNQNSGGGGGGSGVNNFGAGGLY